MRARLRAVQTRQWVGVIGTREWKLTVSAAILFQAHMGRRFSSWLKTTKCAGPKSQVQGPLRRDLVVRDEEAEKPTGLSSRPRVIPATMEQHAPGDAYGCSWPGCPDGQFRQAYSN
jgi:hypothetical protein